MRYGWVAILLFAVWLTGPGRSWASVQGQTPGGEDLALWVASPTAIFLAGVISGIVGVAKRTFLPNNLSPVLALVLGVLGSLAYVQFYGGGLGWRPEVGDVLVRGVTLGLMAGGVWALLKATGKVVSKEEDVAGNPLAERRGRPSP